MLEGCDGLGASALPREPDVQLLADPIAPEISGVVVDLREGWLADVEASPERHAPITLSWYAKRRIEFEWLWIDWKYRCDCVKEFVVGVLTPYHAKSGTPAERLQRAGIISCALLAFAFAVGLAIYLATVAHTLNSRELAGLGKHS